MFWSRKLAPFAEEAKLGDLDAIEFVHAQGFARGWTNGEIQALLNSKGVFCLVLRDEGNKDQTALGFIMVRVAADEAEVLSIGTAPDHRRRGVAKYLMQASIRQLQTDRIACLFLEVAETNNGAISLYRKLGFVTVGNRKNYYADVSSDTNTEVGSNASKGDSALVMRLDLI